MGRIMKIELETKQFMEDLYGKVDNNEVFYRYNIDGNLVWFTQMQDSGNIYSVSVRLLDDSFDRRFGVWVKCGNNKIFYPNNIEIEMKRSNIKPEDIGRVISDIHYIDKLCNMIMTIFRMDEHYKLWSNHHMEIESNKHKDHHCECCGCYIEKDHLKVCDKCASEFKF